MNKEIRLIAEWESCSSVLLALPERHTDWDYILEEARDQYRRMIRSFTDNGLHCVVLVADRVSAGELLQECDSSKITLIEAEYNDTWTRDYGRFPWSGVIGCVRSTSDLTAGDLNLPPQKTTLSISFYETDLS